MEFKTCCVTGHRNIPMEKQETVEARLRREVSLAIEDGYNRFLSGFAEGTDLLFAAIVAEQAQRNPGVCLEAAIPYPNRLQAKDGQFQKLIACCQSVKIVSDHYFPACFMQRNRYMVRQSARVIAVYDGRERGGTLFTMRYAHSLGREIRVIEI